MIVSCLILVLSAALFCFYWQITVERILHRAFDQKYFQTIVTVNRLEFPVLREAFEGLNSSVEYSRMRTIVKCDFLALTYLLKNAGNLNRRHSSQERMLIFYFRLVLISLMTRHWLHLGEKPAVLKLAEILQYFANLVGERLNSVRFGNLSTSEYMLPL